MKIKDKKSFAVKKKAAKPKKKRKKTYPHSASGENSLHLRLVRLALEYPDSGIRIF